MKAVIKRQELYSEPKSGEAPPDLDPRPADPDLHAGVSFFHGSNDGQKGMGLIMLILIGTVPTAYALNRAVEPESQIVAGFKLNCRTNGQQR